MSSTFASKPIKLMQINIDLLNDKVSDNNYKWTAACSGMWQCYLFQVK